MKSYLHAQWNAESLWLNQYPKHFPERKLFEIYGIKYVFVGEDFSKIILAGNSELEPLGKLSAKLNVNVLNTTISTCRQITDYAKAYRKLHSSKDGFCGSYVWHNAILQDEEIQPMANFLHNCGYEIKVAKGAVGHNVVNINGVTHIAIFGDSPNGKNLAIEDLRTELCNALEITEETAQEFLQTNCGFEILPSYVVALNESDADKERKNLAKKLKEKGFQYRYIIAFSPDHSQIYVDFHHKTAVCGVTGNYDKKYEISAAQLEDLLKNL